MRDEWDRQEERSRRWGRLRVFLGVVAVSFVVTLGLVVGNRLSDEALGVLAGAVCGVGAAIPTSLIVVAVTLRNARSSGLGRRDDPFSRGSIDLQHGGHTPQQHGYPPVIVVSPQGGHPWSSGWNSSGYGPSSLKAPLEREFTVVGGTSDSVAKGRHRDGGYSPRA
jgi:hypothetical protein